MIRANGQTVAVANVIICTGRLELGIQRARQNHKDEIGLYRPNRPQTDRAGRIGQFVGHAIGMTGEIEPEMIRQISQELAAKLAPAPKHPRA
jgi:hypothetical protein